jgi:hypothetical protein
MTSSQYDPRPGYDDSIGGDARESSRPFTSLEPIHASHSDGTSHLLVQTDIIDQIFDFNEQVINLPDVDLNPLTPMQWSWTNKFIEEELKEFNDGFGKQDIVAMCDAIGDLIYGAMGTFKKMGLSRAQVRAIFTAIHNANMTKKRGDKGRGTDEDAIKPEGFVPPEDAISEILFLE